MKIVQIFIIYSTYFIIYYYFVSETAAHFIVFQLRVVFHLVCILAQSVLDAFLRRHVLHLNQTVYEMDKNCAANIVYECRI